MDVPGKPSTLMTSEKDSCTPVQCCSSSQGDPCTLMTDSLHQVKNHVTSHGLVGLYDVTSSQLEMLYEEPLYVAVYGERVPQKTLFLRALTKHLNHDMSPLTSLKGLNYLISPSHEHKALLQQGPRRNTLGSIPETDHSTLSPQKVKDKMHAISEEADEELNDSDVINVTTPDKVLHKNGFVTSPSGMLMSPSNDVTPQEWSDGDHKSYSWSIPGYCFVDIDKAETIKSDVSHRNYDVIILTSERSTPDPLDINMAKDCASECNSVFVCTCLDHEIAQCLRQHQEDQDRGTHGEGVFQMIHSQYRKSFFRQSLAALPLFIVACSRSGQFDFPDLCTVLGKWENRKQLFRAAKLHSAAREALDVWLCSRGREGVSRCVALLCCGLSVHNPVVAILSDAGLLITRKRAIPRWFRLQDWGEPEEEKFNSRPNHPEPSTPASLTTKVLHTMPCSLLWMVKHGTMKVLTHIVPGIDEDRLVIPLTVILAGLGHFVAYTALRETFVENEQKSKRHLDYVMRQRIRPHLQSSAGRRFSTSTIESIQ